MERGLTTYLGQLATNQGHKAASLTSTRLPMTLLYVYDAFLTQCAFLTRLSYGSTAVLIDAIKEAMERPAADKNTSIKQNSSDPKTMLEFLINPPAVSAATAKHCSRGFYISAIGCNIFQYYSAKSLINDRKTLFITFRGIYEISELEKVIKKATQMVELKTLVDGAAGSLLQMVSDGIGPYIKFITDTAIRFTEDKAKGVDQIVVTGHSLGGAFATVVGLALRKKLAEQESNVSVNVVSFGAPRFFDEGAKQAFNALLEYGKFTYDNIINDGDEITNYPKTCVYPGLGTTTHIDDVRKQFADIEIIGSEFKNMPYANAEKYPILNDIYTAKGETVGDADGAEAEAGDSETAGGGKETADEKADAAYSNTIIFTCSDSTSICHANYMDIDFETAWTEPKYDETAVLEYLGDDSDAPIDLYMPQYVVVTTPNPAKAHGGAIRRQRKRELKQTRRVLRRKLRALTRARRRYQLR
jgi:hypothetical protein